MKQAKDILKEFTSGEISLMAREILAWQQGDFSHKPCLASLVARLKAEQFPSSVVHRLAETLVSGYAMEKLANE